MIAAVVAITGGATYAWSLQKETISGVTLSAGSMDLKIDNNLQGDAQNWVDSFYADIKINDLKPGGEIIEQKIDIKSVGDPDAKASIKLSLTSNAENTLLTPEREAGDTTDVGIWDGELAQNMKVKISYDEDNDGPLPYVLKDERTLADYHNDPNFLTLGDITSTGNVAGIASVKIEAYIPADVSNKIMTDSVGLNIIFGLE